MALAHAAFVALNAPEADKVQEALEAMTSGKGVLGKQHRETNNDAPHVVLEGDSQIIACIVNKL